MQRQLWHHARHSRSRFAAGEAKLSARQPTTGNLAARAIVALRGEAAQAALLVVDVAAAELEALPLVDTPVILAPVELLCMQTRCG